MDKGTTRRIRNVIVEACGSSEDRFGAPVFSWVHLEEFEGRLSLANAENTYRAVTGYSATTIRTWLAQDRNVWIVECENIPDPEMLGNHSVATVSLERLGSRSFTGWYGGWFAKNPSVGLGKMRAMADCSRNDIGRNGWWTALCCSLQV